MIRLWRGYTQKLHINRILHFGYCCCHWRWGLFAFLVFFPYKFRSHKLCVVLTSAFSKRARPILPKWRPDVHSWNRKSILYTRFNDTCVSEWRQRTSRCLVLSQTRWQCDCWRKRRCCEMRNPFEYARQQIIFTCSFRADLNYIIYYNIFPERFQLNCIRILFLSYPKTELQRPYSSRQGDRNFLFSHTDCECEKIYTEWGISDKRMISKT